MSIAEPLTVLKNELVQKIVPEVVDLLASALCGQRLAKRHRVLGHLPIHVFQTVRVLLEPEHAFDGCVHLAERLLHSQFLPPDDLCYHGADFGTSNSFPRITPPTPPSASLIQTR